MSSGTTDFEALLREALSPIDPPEDLAARMESALVNLTELAQEELETWELKTMRDPRNWVRPAAAVVIGASAGTALVVLRVRGRHRTRRQQSSSLRELAERTLQDFAEEARRVLPDRCPRGRTGSLRARSEPADTVIVPWPSATGIPHVRPGSRAPPAGVRSVPTA